MTKLFDIAEVIRSKNSGPYELTFDIIFKNDKHFNDFVSKNIITKQVFASLYNIKEDDVLSIIPFSPSRALKITIVRPIASGAVGETDVYGAQQHRPLMDFEF